MYVTLGKTTTMNTDRITFGVFGAITSCMVEDLAPLFICVLIFEVVDLVTGIWKSKVVANRRGETWGIESVKLWRTIYKTVFILIGIYLAWMLETNCFPNLGLNLPKLFCGFSCAVELWSFLENAAIISEHPIFRLLQRLMQKQIKEKTGIEEEIKDERAS